MRRGIFFGSMIAALVMAMPASAVVVLDFTGANAGSGSGGLNVASSTNFGGVGIAVDTLTVTGDGTYDGIYHVSGNVSGSLESNVGNLTFSTSASTITIVGGVVCVNVTAACSALDVTNSTQLAPNGTTLMQGTGTFSNVTLTGNGSPIPFVASFQVPDTKDPGLLSALGISVNKWELASVVIAFGSGNPFPVTGVNLANTQLPEPTSVLLLGTVMFAAAHLIRRRAKKA